MMNMKSIQYKHFGKMLNTRLILQWQLWWYFTKEDQRYVYKFKISLMNTNFEKYSISVAPI